MCGSGDNIRVDDRSSCWRMHGSESREGDPAGGVSFRTQQQSAPNLSALPWVPSPRPVSAGAGSCRRGGGGGGEGGGAGELGV